MRICAEVVSWLLCEETYLVDEPAWARHPKRDGKVCDKLEQAAAPEFDVFLIHSVIDLFVCLRFLIEGRVTPVGFVHAHHFLVSREIHLLAPLLKRARWFTFSH